jgi:tape measure domain-containing protein|tara:strand:- start:760 stop:3168 length:2409 start_codon:yes stop_codon:yes gene_type:complete
MARKNEAKFFVTLDTKQYTAAFKKLSAGNANYLKQLKLMQQQEARYRQSQKALGASLTNLARKTEVIAKGYQHFGATLSNNNRIVSTAISGYKSFQQSQQRIATSLGQSTKAIRTQTAALQQQKLAYAGMSGAGRAAALPPVEGPTKPFGKATPILPPVAPRQTYEYERIKTATKEASLAQKGFAKNTEVVGAAAKRTTGRLKAMGNSIAGFARQLKAFAAIIAITQLYKMAEDAGQLNNRILVVSRNTEEFNSNFQRLQVIAKQTRSPLKDTAVLFSRMRIATKRLGYDLDQVAEATENLSKMMRIQGVGAHEARSAVLQLSQALQSGRLAGDEFRAIQEIMPALLGDIARATGYPIEQLKDLAREGKITPQVIMDALLNNTEKINFMFERTKMTVGDMGQQIRNSFLIAFSTMQKNEGVAAGLHDMYVQIAAVFEVVAQSIRLVVNAVLLLNAAFDKLQNFLGKTKKEMSDTNIFFDMTKNKISQLSTALAILSGNYGKNKSAIENAAIVLANLNAAAEEELRINERAKKAREMAMSNLGYTYKDALENEKKLAEETQKIIDALEDGEEKVARYSLAWANLKTGINLADVVENLRELGEGFRETTFKTLVEDFPRGFGDAVADTVMEGKSLKDGLSSLFKSLAKQVISQIVMMITQMLIMKAIMASLGFGGMAFGTGFGGQGMSGLFGGLGKGIGAISKGIGGLFADGGRPPVGVASIVGERGPELFVPDTPGTIIPNEQMGGTVVIQRLEIMPGANIDQALMDKPATYWVDLAQEKILPALNTLGQAGNTTTLKQRESR